MAPTRRQKHRDVLLADAAYFAGELNRCLEGLVDVERSKRLFGDWQQAAGIVRRIRHLLKWEADRVRERRRVELERREQKERMAA